jgi:hypothetical protein
MAFLTTNTCMTYWLCNWRITITWFGADDPYLKVGVAKEFHSLFKVLSLHLISKAGFYVQLDDA